MTAWEKEYMKSIGGLVGVPEDALRLLMGILLAYPIAIVYVKSQIKCCSPNIQQKLIALTKIKFVSILMTLQIFSEVSFPKRFGLHP